VVNGDIHTTNQKLAGLESRDTAKTFIYALVYGAGDEKIGSVVGGSRKQGKELKQRFLDNLPTFKTLKEKVQGAARRGYLMGIDGRKIYIRHEHAALNSLLQGGGAIVMKKALVILANRLELSSTAFKFVANIHDEWQIEVAECRAHKVGELAVQSIIDAGEHFNMRCPLDGEYKIGGDWTLNHVGFVMLFWLRVVRQPTPKVTVTLVIWKWENVFVILVFTNIRKNMFQTLEKVNK
jgi:DNA polymerase I-like protein with 3'-5' exonuclease and polymerase domains